MMSTRKIGRRELLNAPVGRLPKKGISYVVPIIMVIVLIIAFVVGYYVALGNTSTTTQVSTTTVTKSATSNINPICVTFGNCSETLVYIPYYAHSIKWAVPLAPENITVVVGVNNTVMWLNLDTVTHTLVGSSFSTGSLARGATYSYTFTTPGVYAYSSPNYSFLKGTVTVVQSSGATSAPGSGNNNY